MVSVLPPQLATPLFFPGGVNRGELVTVGGSLVVLPPSVVVVVVVVGGAVEMSPPTEGRRGCGILRSSTCLVTVLVTVLPVAPTTAGSTSLPTFLPLLGEAGTLMSAVESVQAGRGI